MCEKVQPVEPLLEAQPWGWRERLDEWVDGNFHLIMLLEMTVVLVLIFILVLRS